MKKFLSVSLAALALTAAAAPAMQPMQRSQMTAKAAPALTFAQKAQKFDANGAFKVAPKATTVNKLYLEPTGTFYSAYFTNGASFSSYAGLLLPPDVPVTFRNISSGATDGFAWLVYDPANDTEKLSEYDTFDLTFSPLHDCAGFWVAPRLFYGADEDYFAIPQGVQYGGAMEFDAMGDGSILTNLSNYNPRDDNYGLKIVGSVIAGKTADDETGNFYTEMLEETETDATHAFITSYLQHFLAPARPYAFSRVNFLARAKAKAGQTLTCKICVLNEQGIIQNDKPVATATYTFENDTEGENIEDITFYFEKYDEATGLTEEDWVNMDQEMFVYIDGADQLELIEPITYAIDRDFYINNRTAFAQHGYCEWVYTNAAGKVVDDIIYACHGGYFWGNSESSGLPGDLLLSLNAQFDYIVAEDTEFAANVAGETKTLTVDASGVLDTWEITGSEDGMVPDWITIDGEDVFVEDEDGEYFGGQVELSVTCDALPEGVTYREADVTFKLKTQSITLHVTQGTKQESIPGDVNNDGVVDITDVNCLINVVLEKVEASVYEGRADVNGDGLVDVSDVNALISITLK